MEPAVKARYTSEVRAAVASTVGVEPDRMRDLGGFDSFVHEARVDGTPRIVKATWGGRRSADELGAEIHFVNWLADRGAPVARPLPLAGGGLREAVPAGESVFHVTSWAKAQGRSLRRDELAPEIFVPWGALRGGHGDPGVDHGLRGRGPDTCVWYVKPARRKASRRNS